MTTLRFLELCRSFFLVSVGSKTTVTWLLGTRIEPRSCRRGAHTVFFDYVPALVRIPR